MTMLESIAAKIAAIKLARELESIKNPKNLVTVCINYYLASDKSLEDNYKQVKKMLYAWCIIQPRWSIQYLNQQLADITRPPELLLSFDEAYKLLELSHQIARFLNFGEYYWSEEWQWDTGERVNHELLLNLILQEYNKHAKQLQNGTSETRESKL